jgi:hypothetical protein
MCAAIRGDEGIYGRLLRLGADPESGREDEATAWDLAIASGHRNFAADIEDVPSASVRLLLGLQRSIWFLTQSHWKTFLLASTSICLLLILLVKAREMKIFIGLLLAMAIFFCGLNYYKYDPSGSAMNVDELVIEKIRVAYGDMAIIVESMSAMELASSFPYGSYWSSMGADEALRKVNALSSKLDAGVAAQKRIMESMANVEILVNDESLDGIPELRERVLELTSIRSSSLETSSLLRSTMSNFEEFLSSH